MRQGSTLQGLKTGAWDLIWYLRRQMTVSYTVWRRFLLKGRTITEHIGCMEKECICHYLLILLIRDIHPRVMGWTNLQQATLNRWDPRRLLITLLTAWGEGQSISWKATRGLHLATEKQAGDRGGSISCGRIQLVCWNHSLGWWNTDYHYLEISRNCFWSL